MQAGPLKKEGGGVRHKNTAVTDKGDTSSKKTSTKGETPRTAQANSRQKTEKKTPKDQKQANFDKYVEQSNRQIGSAASSPSTQTNFENYVGISNKGILDSISSSPEQAEQKQTNFENYVGLSNKNISDNAFNSPDWEKRYAILETYDRLKEIYEKVRDR